MSKRAIPQLPSSVDLQQKKVIAAIAENLEIITGQRIGKIESLPATADLTAVIQKINEIIERLQ